MTDRYGGPGAWDRHCEERERAYRALAAARTCLDCAKCAVSPWHPDEGFCMEACEFVNGDDTVAEVQCDVFEEG